MTANLDNMPAVALDYLARGHRVAMATVLQTWGSAPRPVGAQLAICDDGSFQGSVSGGCVEGAVVAEALEVLETGTPRILDYGVSDEEVFAVGLACGGELEILVEPVGRDLGLTPETLQTLVEARAKRKAMGLAINLTTWSRDIIYPKDNPTRFASDKSGVDETAAGEVFTLIQNPDLRLIVVGAVHIAQALMPMARLAGYQTHLIDPRGSFGSESRFPDEKIIADWPDEAVSALGLDPRTALVTLTHDPKLDTPALSVAIRSGAFYVGALGSKRTHSKRMDQLQELGHPAPDIARISGPVGLDISATTPAEIAVSILAEMTQTLRQQVG